MGTGSINGKQGCQTKWGNLGWHSRPNFNLQQRPIYVFICNKQSKKRFLFSQNKAHYLIHKCTTHVADVYTHTKNATTPITLPELEIGTFFLNKKRESRSVNTIVKTYDAMQSKRQCVTKRFLSTHHLIDINARHTFTTGTKRHVIKCVYRFNHHAVQENIFNPLMSTRCDIYGGEETWEHILRCPSMFEANQSFITKLKDKLNKLDTDGCDITRFFNNISLYLAGMDKLEGSQAVIGYCQLFRGFIVNDWFGVNALEGKYAAPNRIIVFEAVSHYCINWRSRNNRRNSDIVKRERILNWTKAEKLNFQNYKSSHLASYMANYDRVVKLDTDSIQRWLISLHTLRKKTVRPDSMDIRSFFLPTT